MSGSDTKYLRAAVVLMEELNFSRAATKLNIGQSALSEQIGHLHDRVLVLLRDSKLLVSEIAAQTGFADQSHLTRLMRQHQGITPGQVRQRS